MTDLQSILPGEHIELPTLTNRIAHKLWQAFGAGTGDSWRQAKFLIVADELIAMALDREKIGRAICAERVDGRPWDEEQGREIADRVIKDLKA